jgi:uncharacterized protein YecT (DUF1311 family)
MQIHARKLGLAAAMAAVFFSVPALAASLSPDPSFDCREASTVVEVTVCGDSELAALDREMADLYARLLKVTGDKKGLQSDQRNFIKHRDQQGEYSQRYAWPAGVLTSALKDNVYRPRVDYLKKALNPEEIKLPKGWVNLDQGQKDPCRGDRKRCDPGQYGLDGVYGGGKVLWTNKVWLNLTDGDPDPCRGVYDYQYCDGFTGNIMKGDTILLKHQRPAE